MGAVDTENQVSAPYLLVPGEKTSVQQEQAMQPRHNSITVPFDVTERQSQTGLTTPQWQTWWHHVTPSYSIYTADNQSSCPFNTSVPTFPQYLSPNQTATTNMSLTPTDNPNNAGLFSIDMSQLAIPPSGDEECIEAPPAGLEEELFDQSLLFKDSSTTWTDIQPSLQWGTQEVTTETTDNPMSRVEPPYTPIHQRYALGQLHLRPLQGRHAQSDVTHAPDLNIPQFPQRRLLSRPQQSHSSIIGFGMLQQQHYGQIPSEYPQFRSYDAPFLHSHPAHIELHTPRIEPRPPHFFPQQSMAAPQPCGTTQQSTMPTIRLSSDPFADLITKYQVGLYDWAENREKQNAFLVEAKRRGLSYKDILRRGQFNVAEATLRTRHRTAVKRKEQRLRRPQWTRKDEGLLREAVQALAKPPPPGGVVRKKISQEERFNSRVPWKQVGEYVHAHGGSYHFGATTCKKKWMSLEK